MIKLIVGKKGFGKTKTLIDLVNQAVKEKEGSVACIEKGVKLTYDISHKARLVNTEEFGVDNYESLYGFVAGMIASNYDIKSIFIDSITKICNDDMEGFGFFLDKISEKITDTEEFVITVSADPAEVPDSVKKYM
ncbi:MAG: ATP-binding protein [Clostridia bacterium]|nr:ATP-binding protein [Clostridia bacterium]